MEKIWILTNSKREFIKAIAKREEAIKEMEKWRESFIKIGIFNSISKIDSVYNDRISFKVTDREGKELEMVARAEILN